MERKIEYVYRDPLALIWIDLLKEIGFLLARSPETFASYDGAGTLIIGSDETLDADDSLAQMIFHEICHRQVARADKDALVDWGMDNISDRDTEEEWACLRLQTSLASEHGLRQFLAPTTDFRAYYDTLPEYPLDDGTPASEHARKCRTEMEREIWWPTLQSALLKTRAIAELVRNGDPKSLWNRVD